MVPEYQNEEALLFEQRRWERHKASKTRRIRRPRRHTRQANDSILSEYRADIKVDAIPFSWRGLLAHRKKGCEEAYQKRPMGLLVLLQRRLVHHQLLPKKSGGRRVRDEN